MVTRLSEKMVCPLLWVILLLAQSTMCSMGLQNLGSQQWVQAPPVRVLIKSSADWIKTMFDDDQDGTNRNGIRIRSILRSGWMVGSRPDYIIIIANKAPWHDVLYNTTVDKFGDMVAFNKGRNNFNYTEMYAELVFEVDMTLSTGYVWLMLAGQGITSFELANVENNYVFWRETLSGTGHTSHVQRHITIGSFFRTWDVSNLSVATLIGGTLLVILALSPFGGTIRAKGKKTRSTHDYQDEPPAHPELSSGRNMASR